MKDKKYWAMFAAACLMNGDSPTDAAIHADIALDQMRERFPDRKLKAPWPPTKENPWCEFTQKARFDMWQANNGL